MTDLFYYPKMTKITSLIVLASTVFTLTACSSGAGIKGIAEPPKVSVQNVQMDRLNWQGGEAKFTLNVANPNAFPLPLTGFDYRLKLNNVAVANGERNEPMTIPSRQSKQVTVPLKLSFVNIASMLPGLIRKGTMHYELAGSAHLPWLNIPFTRSGATKLRP